MPACPSLRCALTRFGLAAGALLAGAIPASAAVMLVENGVAKAEVIVATNATGDERNAADELVGGVKKATGATLVIRAERTRGRPAVLIGAAAASEPTRAKLAALNGAGYLVDAHGDTLVLAGKGRDGTSFAVYEFLERCAGVRWLWPGELGEIVPARKTLTVEDMTLAREPAFAWRWLGPGGALWGPHDRWSKERELGVSREHQAAQLRWEKRNRFGGENFYGGHAFGEILPPAVYGATHPEYYALVNGKRDCDPARFDGKHRCQPCTSNPEVIAKVVEYCQRMFAIHPELDGVSIGLNDGRGFCECDNCRRLDTGKVQRERNDPEQQRATEAPVLTDRMMTYCNEVAAKLERTHPNKKVLFFGYSQFHEPPERTQVHPNVVVAYTVHCAGFWNQPAREKAFKDLAAWKRAAPGLGVYEYFAQTNFPDMPRLVPDLIQVELQELQRLGSRYFHTQAGNGFAVNGLNYYVLGRLLWDPSADVKAIQADYVQNAFGPGAAAMNRYYERLMASWRSQQSEPVRMLGFQNYEEVTRAYPRELRDACRQDLEEAARATAGDYRRRVEFVRAGFRFFDQTMAATDATYPLVKANWRPGSPPPASIDAKQVEQALSLWRERDAYVEEHREDFVLSYLWVKGNGENAFNPLKRLRAPEAPAKH